MYQCQKTTTLFYCNYKITLDFSTNLIYFVIYFIKVSMMLLPKHINGLSNYPKERNNSTPISYRGQSNRITLSNNFSDVNNFNNWTAIFGDSGSNQNLFFYDGVDIHDMNPFSSSWRKVCQSNPIIKSTLNQMNVHISQGNVDVSITDHKGNIGISKNRVVKTFAQMVGIGRSLVSSITQGKLYGFASKESILTFLHEEYYLAPSQAALIIEYSSKECMAEHYIATYPGTNITSNNFQTVNEKQTDEYQITINKSNLLNNRLTFKYVNLSKGYFAVDDSGTRFFEAFIFGNEVFGHDTNCINRTSYQSPLAGAYKLILTYNLAMDATAAFNKSHAIPKGILQVNPKEGYDDLDRNTFTEILANIKHDLKHEPVILNPNQNTAITYQPIQMNMEQDKQGILLERLGDKIYSAYVGSSASAIAGKSEYTRGSEFNTNKSVELSINNFNTAIIGQLQKYLENFLYRNKIIDIDSNQNVYLDIEEEINGKSISRIKPYHFFPYQILFNTKTIPFFQELEYLKIERFWRNNGITLEEFVKNARDTVHFKHQIQIPTGEKASQYYSEIGLDKRQTKVEKSITNDKNTTE